MPKVSYEISTGKPICGDVLTKNVLYQLSYVGIRSIYIILFFNKTLSCLTLGSTSMVEGAGFEPANPFKAAILQTAPINHSGTPPHTTNETQYSPRGDSNPLTYRLQVGCAAIAPLGHYVHKTLATNANWLEYYKNE